jgi:rare lipoprotein A
MGGEGWKRTKRNAGRNCPPGPLPRSRGKAASGSAAAVLRPILLAGSTLLASCVARPVPAPRYVLGAPYQAGGVWWYPRATAQLDETGLAQIYGPGHASLTSDGEAYDPTAMAAANQVLPLPSIAQVTNLETGRQVVLRINDRGPDTPTRMLAVTPRVAELLGFAASGVARIRLRVLEAQSQEAQAALPGAPSLDIAAAPRGAVQAASLPPPPGARGSAGAAGGATPVASAPVPAGAVPLRLPEAVTQIAPDPGQLWLDLGGFPTYEFATMRRAQVIQLGATVEAERQGRTRIYRVMVGPIADVPEADRLLRQALAAGVPDGRIEVR